MQTVVSADGDILQRILDTTDHVRYAGLSRVAFGTYESALGKTEWGTSHQRRWALVDGRMCVLASARQCDLTAVLDGRHVQVCGIGAVLTDPTHGDASHSRELVEQLLGAGRRTGADLALLSIDADHRMDVPAGFEPIPTLDIELRVTESSRHGAPMTLVRGGEDRDLGAIAAMGQARAGPFRFHLDRDVDFVKHAITNKRLLAGLGRAGARQLRFVIAEEGITAAAYLVLSVTEGTWTIEECGDRDPSGARVGAIFQALIAQEPAERRPIIRGWLPPGFVPPQVTVASARQSEDALMIGILDPTIEPPRLSGDDLLYWRGDIP